MCCAVTVYRRRRNAEEGTERQGWPAFRAHPNGIDIAPRLVTLNNRRRTSTRDNFANTMRSGVAVIAATIDSKMKLPSGTARPMNDIAVQVGGVKAGKHKNNNE